MAIEIVDLPIKNGDFPVRYVSSPEVYSTFGQVGIVLGSPSWVASSDEKNGMFFSVGPRRINLFLARRWCRKKLKKVRQPWEYKSGKGCWSFSKNITGSWWKAQAQNNESVLIPFLRKERNTCVPSGNLTWLLKMAINSGFFPIKKCYFPVRYVSLPEGNFETWNHFFKPPGSLRPSPSISPGWSFSLAWWAMAAGLWHLTWEILRPCRCNWYHLVMTNIATENHNF